MTGRMRETLLVTTLCLLLGVMPSADCMAQNLVANPSAEEVTDGFPVGWGMYRGKGTGSWGATDEAHSGERGVFLRVDEFGEWGGGPYINVGVLVAESNGYDGSRATPATPGTDYHFSLWLKGDIPWLAVQAYVWSENSGALNSRSSVVTTLGKVTPAADWTQYEGIFTTRADTRRFALHLHVAGHEAEGMSKGVLYVDDVVIEAGEAMPPTSPPRPPVLPDVFHPTIGGRSVEELREAVAAGDAETLELVEKILERANATWAVGDDSRLLSRRAAFTPVGLWTVACPFHPERVRDFSKDNFEWSIDDPWHLVCKLCRDEGRELYRYPNERYPDDGTGCYPTDEVWREDHDAQWSREHSGIPWDHWDGKPHGYSAAGYCYYFLGKCAQEIMTWECRWLLPTLSQSYVIARHVLPDDDARRDRADEYAHRAKVVLHSLARAHLGDDYLAAAAGVDPAAWRSAIAEFYSDDPEGLAATHFPGYTPYGLQDGILGDAAHPPRGRPDVFADGSYRGDMYAKEWLRAYALVRDSYTDDEELIRRTTERLLVAQAGDDATLAEAGTEVKQGKLDIDLRPYDMTVGGSNNLGGRELATKFAFGELLGDDEAIDGVVSNVRYYLRNYFGGDGLGREGSPAYTSCAWNTLSAPLKLIYGYRGSYDETHPWWDNEIGGLNPYRDRYFREATSKLALSLYPNGRFIPWMDSHVEAGLPLRYLELAAGEGGDLSEDCEQFYSVGGGDVALREPVDLPSVLHHASRKAVLRAGPPESQVALAIDYSPDTGHWHPAPMDLLMFAHGHELASDLGYFGAMSQLTRNWIRTCAAHNTCIIRAESGEHRFIHDVQGDVQGLVKLGGGVQVIGIEERDPGELSHIPGDGPVYARTAALIATDEAHPYVVDFFRARGGAVHDYMFHSQGRRCEVTGVDLVPEQDIEKGLYQAGEFTTPQATDYGSGLVRSLRTCRTDGPFTVTWRDVPDWANDGEVDPQAGLRLTMLGRPGTELLVGIAPGQRRMNNADLGEKLHVACVRRDNTADVDTFMAVIEPLGGEPAITSATEAPVQGSEHARAVRVTLTDRIDLALINPDASPDQPVTCEATGLPPVRTDAEFLFVSARVGGPLRVDAVGGSETVVGDTKLRPDGPYRGRLVSFDDDAKTLLVEAAGELPAGDALRDRVMVLRHATGTSTLTVDSVRPVEGDLYEIALRWTPHLGENYFRAVDVQGAWVRLQPPHSLPRKFEELHYQLYAAGPGPAESACGEIVRRTGEWFRIGGDLSSLAAGQDVMLTRLRAGEDRFVIPAITTATGDGLD